MSDPLLDKVCILAAENERLRNALIDMLAGWRYIRRTGNLNGIEWDRCEEKANAALGDDPHE